MGDDFIFNRTKYLQNTKSDTAIFDAQKVNRELEDQVEQLNCSLIAITTHCAQMQFRLHQIIEAPREEKEDLIKELENFSNNGIPEINNNFLRNKIVRTANLDTTDLEQNIIYQREKQRELLLNLEDLLKSYQEHKDRERQLVALRKQMKSLRKVKASDSRNKMSKLLTNNLLEKDHFVDQLKLQILDLESFVTFLKTPKSLRKPHCLCRHTKGRPLRKNRKSIVTQNVPIYDLINDQAIRFFNRTIMIIYLIVEEKLRKFFRISEINVTTKRAEIENHWGCHRAKLEIAIADVMDVVSPVTFLNDQQHFNADDIPDVLQKEITFTVRKKLCKAMRNLIEHGLKHTDEGLTNLFHPELSQNKPLHAWQLIVLFYERKDGEWHNSSPKITLAKSFGLQFKDESTTLKEELLENIGNIISSHAPYKKSKSSQFKAFVSAALNRGRLTTWLRMIFSCQKLICQCYHPWSYVAKTGFEDALHSLERFTQVKFNLPVDRSVRRFKRMNDVF